MLALEVKGIDYTPRRLDNAKREQKAPEFLKINPRGQVPVLVHDGTTVCETLAILAYLDAIVPEPPLFGVTPATTALVWQIVSECEGGLRERVSEISRPLFRGKGEEFADRISAGMARVRDELALLESRLGSSPWLAGDTLSAADLVVFPVVMQLGRAAARPEAEPMKLGVVPLSKHWPYLDAWRKRVEALDGYDSAYPPHWK